jgi:hypothetical protein
MSPRLLAGGACALFLLAGAVHAGSPLPSGPQVGSRNNRSGFLPRWVTGPCAGKQLCPV